MPGYVMLHEHLLFLDSTADPAAYLSEPLWSPKAYLAHGATTIRTGGTFSGPVLNGRVLPGGADYQLLRSATLTELTG